MAKPNTHIKFTYADYKSIPETETKRYELLGGDLVVAPSPTFEHQRIAGNLEYALRKFVDSKKLGLVLHAPLDVHLIDEETGEEEVVQPDILFISQENFYIIAEEEIQGAPELVIEILSPTTAERDRGFKRTLYARHGIQEYWLVDPETKTIEVLIQGEGGFEPFQVFPQDATLESPLLTGLQAELQEVF